MENNQTRRIHPLLAAAAVAVILVSLVGVAAMTGLLPDSRSGNPEHLASVATIPPTPTESATTTANHGEAAARAPEPAIKKSSRPAPKHSAPRSADVAQPTSTSTARTASICHSCGRVESIQAVQQAAQPSGLGVAAGAVLGGVLGNQVGGGNGRTLATIAGAVGGGYAGNEVEKRTRTSTSYEVQVRMEDGTLQTFRQASANDWRVGDRVQVVNGALRSRG